MDFREYLLGLALLNESKDRTKILKLVFSVYDHDGNGKMSMDELSSFLARCGCADVEVHKVLFEATGREEADAMTYDEFQTLIGRHPEYMKVFNEKLKYL